MGLSSEIISQFVKSTNDAKKETPKETTVYGTTVKVDGKTYVKIDGSELLTPVNSTVSTNDGDKVTVVVGNHTATITGNMTDPSASSKVVEEQGSMVQEFETVMAYKVTTKDLEAVNAAIENLRVVTAKIQDATIVNATIERLYAKLTETDKLTATDIKAITAEIETLKVDFGKFGDLSAEDAEIVRAEITNLEGYTADFTYVIADELEAIHADIEQADIKYANIDFANITEAAVEKLFAGSGIIKDFVMDDGAVTGELIGVTIKGDLIEAGTVKVDRLVVKGTDGQYYALNTNFDNIESVSPVDEETIHGSVMAAKSVTAEKINVKDLVAFDATIGGFTIMDEAIHSELKSSVDNLMQGIYLDKHGQMSVGDNRNFFKYYKDVDENGQTVYRLALAAESIKFGVGQDFTLNNDGMTIEGDNDSNNRIKTNISNQGMTVYADEQPKLIANEKGVAAEDLDATTYLIVGGRCRFENYTSNGTKRTGCFWIGGNN